jgi:hypothetical protein
MTGFSILSKNFGETDLGGIMALLRPSLMLILDLDERLATTETTLEIKRCYTYIGTPLIRTHAPEVGEGVTSEDAPIVNTARMMVNLGTKKYLHSADEGADELWDTVVEQWIGNMLHKIGTTMRAFNKRQRKIGLPEVVFDRFNVELQASEFVVSLHTDPQSYIDEGLKSLVTQVRGLLNDGKLGTDVKMFVAPTDESYETQRAQAWDAWIEAHPEALEQPEPEVEVEPEPEEELTREEWLERDKQAKSYENTAVAPTDSDELPEYKGRVEEEEEPEQFAFEINYAACEVVYADGTKRAFNLDTQAFEG